MSVSWIDAVTQRFYCPGFHDAMPDSAVDRRVSTPRPVAGIPARTGYFLDEKETSRYD